LSLLHRFLPFVYFSTPSPNLTYKIGFFLNFLDITDNTDMFEFIQSVFLKHELTFLIGSYKVFFFFFYLKGNKYKRKALNPDLWTYRTNISPLKDFNISDKGCWTECWRMLTLPSPPSDPGPSVLLIGVKYLQNYDIHGT